MKEKFWARLCLHQACETTLLTLTSPIPTLKIYSLFYFESYSTSELKHSLYCLSTKKIAYLVFFIRINHYMTTPIGQSKIMWSAMRVRLLFYVSFFWRKQLFFSKKLNIEQYLTKLSTIRIFKTTTTTTKKTKKPGKKRVTLC